MDRVQSVRIRLSDGSVGVFWGYPIAELPLTENLKVVDVVFESPKYVSGISHTLEKEIDATLEEHKS